MAILLTLTKEKRNDDTICFIARGRIGTNEAHMLETKLNRELSDNPPVLLLDMCEVEFLSSMGIRVLLSTYKKTVEAGITFRIINPSENAKNVIGMVSLEELLL